MKPRAKQLNQSESVKKGLSFSSTLLILLSAKFWLALVHVTAHMQFRALFNFDLTYSCMKLFIHATKVPHNLRSTLYTNKACTWS